MERGIEIFLIHFSKCWNWRRSRELKTTKQQKLSVFEGKRVSTEQRAKACWPIRSKWKIRLQRAKCMKFCKSERMLTSASWNCWWLRNMSALYSDIWKFGVCHSDRKSPVCWYQGLSSSWDSVRTESDQTRRLWRQRIKSQDREWPGSGSSTP